MIYVFKTSVKTRKAVRQLRPQLASLLQGTQWNFDLEDCDKILRIDSQTEVTEIVSKLLHGKGFICEELPG
jgi:hypothetical protein